MTPPRHPTRFPGDRGTPTPAVERVEPEREITQPYSQRLTLDEIVELAGRRRCDICQQEGGPLHTIAVEVQKIGDKVEAAVATLSERRGEKRVWAILRPIAVTLLVGAATLTLNHLSAKRADEQARKQLDAAAEVKAQLGAFRATHPMPVEVSPVQP